MGQLDLFSDNYTWGPGEAAGFAQGFTQSFAPDFDKGPFVPPGLEGQFGRLFELSIDAYYSALYAYMSGLPIGGEIARFVEKVGKSRDRAAAAIAASDRGDPDVAAVLRAAGKVLHEIHRINGFLRFNPDVNGVYVARCAPDHFILPALADHFTLRFGETPWAIIDEKRGLRLYRDLGGPVKLEAHRTVAGAEKRADDSWEDLWKLYHRSVNNEGRKNLKLQGQLIPGRYRKYLPEMDKGGDSASL